MEARGVMTCKHMVCRQLNVYFVISMAILVMSLIGLTIAAHTSRLGSVVLGIGISVIVLSSLFLQILIEIRWSRHNEHAE